MDEINVMKKVSDGSNPHVLKMLGCVTTTLPMMLVLQFVPHGSLKDYLKAMRTVNNVRNKVATLASIPARVSNVEQDMCNIQCVYAGWRFQSYWW